MSPDLTTAYLGLRLKHPVVPSASPLTNTLDGIRRLEDAGASAMVLHSLFEEQLVLESAQLDHYLSYFTEAFAEALDWFPDQAQFLMGPEEYLDKIRRAKEAVDIPIIGSLNGITPGGWTAYARAIQEAGADALELNIYHIPTELGQDGSYIETLALDTLRAVRAEVTIPVAVKLSPFYSSIPNICLRLAEAGADGLVLFNRFYQPDLDLESLEVVPNHALSRSEDMRLPLRWTALLYGRIDADLAITSGVHTPEDVIKGLMAGAKVTMMASELLQQGTARLGEVVEGVRRWLEQREYASVEQMQGSMSQAKSGDPVAFERANYMRVLQSWRPDPAGQLYREMLR
ncbi:MAG TPA: dihydroorotate dehydrogenase-like protein [Chloroflexi bacterium]|jgi:dihydroorotate dehydrogenase (fumarate)|nr:dihydroorotate dehydrogenase-like protein [Chloroflexota bacterium]